MMSLSESGIDRNGEWEDSRACAAELPRLRAPAKVHGELSAELR